jgi:alkylation response protein AidB-like acyl-CoA dehydrogenase
MRPVSAELDRMTPEAVIAPASPLWKVFEKAQALGLCVLALAELPHAERARLVSIAIEELAWGDAGVATAMLVNQGPGLIALLAGNMPMARYCEGKLGCWAITEPDHGSDMLDAAGHAVTADGQYGRPNCTARITDGRIVINGQKSAWVSGAMTAQVCALFCHLEEGGRTRPGVSVIVPLDIKGVSRGKPLDKMGLRAANQGELYFDNVEVPLSHLLAGPDTYQELVYLTLCDANPQLATLTVGVARAAFEHALAYAHQRKQGGVPIIRHQNVRARLFDMFRKVESARALTRRVLEFNATAQRPHMLASTSAKVTASQTAFEVASDALQMFGGYGTTREYPMEKLLRDARSYMIADGANDVLAIVGGSMLINPDLLR